MTDREAATLDDVVVGAGPVGCLLALLLARRGKVVQMYERGLDPRVHRPKRGRSNHLVISERSWSAMARAGVASSIREICMPLVGRTVHPLNGPLGFYPYGDTGQAIWAINRTDLNTRISSLALAHENVRVAFGQRCIAVDLATNAIELEDVATGERRHVVARRIFGADGAFSRVRASLMRTDRFDFTQRFLRSGYKELNIPSHDGTWPFEPDKFHVWPRGARVLGAFPNPDKTFSAALHLPFEGEDSFASLRTEDDLRDFFERTFPDALPLMTNLVHDFFQHPTMSIVTISCSSWVHRNRLALIGDAAHAIAPFLGQGMNAGFEDCAVLDDLVEQYAGDWDQIFPEYFRLRKTNCDALADLSDRNVAELNTRVADQRFLLQKKLELEIHRAYPDRFVPVYTMVAFTHIPYARVAKRADEQEAIMEQLMAIPDVEARWKTPEVQARVHELVGSLPPP